MTLILNNDQIAGLLTMADCIDVLEDAYRELAAGRAITRRRSDSLAPTARADAVYGLKSMDGVVPKQGVGAVRINSDIITWPEVGGSRRRVKIPAAPGGRYTGLVLLFSTETGEPLAIFPDGVVQRMRVGATNGLGIKYLARGDASTVGILGSGWQAGTQLTAAAAVRPIASVKCFSPDEGNRRAFAAAMTETLGIPVTPANSAEAALAGADIALCATSSIAHVFFERFAEPGMHVSSIKLPEVEPAAIRRADRTVIHSRFGTPDLITTEGLDEVERSQGESWKTEDEIDFSRFSTLPELITGAVPGRQGDEEITCFLNNLGLGLQFAAVGALVHAKARERGIGNEVPTDWFTELEHP